MVGKTKGKGPEFLEYSVSSSPFFFSRCSKYNLNIKEVIFQVLYCIYRYNFYFFLSLTNTAVTNLLLSWKGKDKPALLWFKCITIQLKSNLGFQMGSLLFWHATLGKKMWYFITSTVSSDTMTIFFGFFAGTGIVQQWPCSALSGGCIHLQICCSRVCILPVLWQMFTLLHIWYSAS